MQLLITKSNIHKHNDLMEKVYHFRHKFFVDHMKWEAIRKPDEREIDDFDKYDPVHIVGTLNDQVISYSRLLHSLKPHLLSHVYPEMLQGEEEPVGENIWEWTRCAVDPSMREGGRGADIATIGMTLGVTEACLHLGIQAVHVQTHPMLLTRLLELGWDCKPLALPSNYDGQPVIPILAKVDESTLKTSRQLLGMQTSILTIEASNENNDRENRQLNNSAN